MSRFFIVLAISVSLPAFGGYSGRVFVWGTVSRVDEKAITLKTKKGDVKVPRLADGKQRNPVPGDKAGIYTTLGQIQKLN